MGAARTATRTGVVLAALVTLWSAAGTASADQQDEGVDISISIGGSTYYFLPTSSSGGLRPEVSVPASTQDRTIRVTYDLTQVYGAVRVLADDRCAPAGPSAVYHCDRDLMARPEPTMLLMVLPIGARSGAGAGPVGQVTATATQIGNTDPNPGNATMTFTIDIDTGVGQTLRVDAGEATGRIGQTVTVPATMTNLGPNTVQWMATTFPTMVPGLEVVGHEGCAGTGYVSGRLCDTAYLAGGQSRTIGVRVRIDACPDPHIEQFGLAIHTSSNDATFVHGTSGSVKVDGCAPTASGGSPGGASGGTPAGSASLAAEPDDAASPPARAGDIDRSAVDFAAAESAVAHGASVPPAAAADDLVAAGNVRRGDGGVGLVGLLALLTVPVVVRAVRTVGWVRAGPAVSREST